MALIYAFRDASGIWYGDPYADILESEPGHDTLTVPASAGPERSMFAGQRLHALYARTDLEAGPAVYRLDGGAAFHATWHVHELLEAPYQPAIMPAPAMHPAVSASTRALDVEISYAPYRYALSAHWTGPDRLDMTVVVTRTDTGEIFGELTGDVAKIDLEHLSELLACAARACPDQETVHPSPSAPPAAGRKPGPSNTGEPWTEELHEELRRRFREGADAEELAAEFGRGVRSIRWKLWALKVAEFPRDLVSEPSVAPARSAAPKAWTASEKRRENPNAYRRWSAEDDQRLARRSAEGASPEQLCAEFGRDRGAIDSRLGKIGATGPAADQARSLA